MPFSALSGKRWSGYLSWRRRRRFVHRRDVLDALTAAVHDENPVCILVTGDLVHIGLAEEINAAGAWLRELGTPDRVMLVPGNHDHYARDSQARVAAAWAPYLPVSASGDGFPLQRRFGESPRSVDLIGVSSADPSPLFMATGALGREQLSRLDRALADAAGFRCLLIHHPPLPAMTAWRKRLRDAPTLETVLAHRGCELVLHGHVHRNAVRVSEGGTRIYATASASSAAGRSPAAYRSFDLTPTDRGWQVSMRLMEVTAEGSVTERERDAWSVSVAMPPASAASGAQ